MYGDEVCVWGRRVGWVKVYISAFERNACWDVLARAAGLASWLEVLQRGPDSCLLPLTVYPTPITRCMLFPAYSTMMHSPLHTHSHSNTHTRMKASLHFNMNHAHDPFLPCKHVVRLFKQRHLFWPKWYDFSLHNSYTVVFGNANQSPRLLQQCNIQYT